jgi:hypothetical protein
MPYDSTPRIRWRLAEDRPARGFEGSGKVRCDLDGRFEIRVPEERTYRLEVSGVWPPVFRPVEAVRAGTRDLVILAAKAGTITGRIRNREGGALHWPGLAAVPREKVGSDGRPRASGGHWSGDGQGNIDKEGRFRIEGLLGERYVIVAYDRKSAATFREAAVGEDVEIVLDPGLSLSGRVVGKDGKPPPKGIIRLEDSLGVHRQEFAGPDGAFAFAGLPEGPCRVEAMAEEYQLAILESVEPGTEALKLTLEPLDAEEFQRRTSESRK